MAPADFSDDLSQKCPLCRRRPSDVQESDRSIFTICCAVCSTFRITEEAYLFEIPKLTAEAKCHLSAIVRRHFDYTHRPETITQKNCRELVSSAPDKNDVTGKIRYLLQYIARKSSFPGERITLKGQTDYPVCFAANVDEFGLYADSIKESGFVDGQRVEGPPADSIGDYQYWLTPKGWEEVQRVPILDSPNAFEGLLSSVTHSDIPETDLMNPDIVRQQILQAILKRQGTSAAYVPDEVIAEAIGLDVDAIQGHLEILEDQGRVELAKHQHGCGAHLTPKQQQRVRELKAMTGAPLQSGPVDPRKVFVVYGRNEVARKAVFDFLRAIGLHPLEWSEIVRETGEASPYVGKVLEVGFSLVQAVVVLMTPDDEARLREPYRGQNEPPDETELTPQPRPNVLLEAGMALGLHPKRTVIIELGHLRPISDIGGRHVVRLSNSPEKRKELAQRLETAGCAVNLTGTDWLKVGDFDLVVVGSPTSLSTDEASLSDPGTQEALQYLDGLSADELYRIGVALVENTQTIETGRNDSVAASLVHKRFLERIPFESTLKHAEVPHLIPNPIWQYLCEHKDRIIERAVAANPTRQDRLQRLRR